MARKIKLEEISFFHEYDIHYPTKTLFMGSDTEFDFESGVDATMAERVIKGVHLLDLVDPEKPMTIIMNNPGGDWYHGMAIYDAIRNAKSYVRIIVYGHAMSMGSIILQAADERIMAPNARCMIHYGYNGFSGHDKSFIKWAEEAKRINKNMEDIYLDKIRQQKPKFTRRKLQELLNFDQFLSASETIELGLADKEL